jgi:hypothetical protein
MIVSSVGVGLSESDGVGLDADVGANVWAGKPPCVARIDKAIHRLRRFPQIDLIRKNLR